MWLSQHQESDYQESQNIPLCFASKYKGWECSPVEEYLPSMHKALAWIPWEAKKKSTDIQILCSDFQLICLI
jgi:hypothetical protein